MLTYFSCTDHNNAIETFATQLRFAHCEHLLVAHLGKNQEVIEASICCDQANDHVIFPYRDIVRNALNCGSASVFLAHNHPSGDPRPSRNDIRLTHRLADVLAPLSVRVHDHLIIAGQHMVSMKRLNLI